MVFEYVALRRLSLDLGMPTRASILGLAVIQHGCHNHRNPQPKSKPTTKNSPPTAITLAIFWLATIILRLHYINNVGSPFAMGELPDVYSTRKGRLILTEEKARRERQRQPPIPRLCGFLSSHDFQTRSQ